MVNNIVYNDKVQSLNKDEIPELLGKPDRVNENYFIIWLKRTDYGFGHCIQKQWSLKL